MIQVRLGRLRSSARGRQHDLPVLPVDHVAVVVDGGEIVVGADLLDLPNVSSSGRSFQSGTLSMVAALRSRSARREVRLTGQRPFGHRVEAERRARRLDVVAMNGVSRTCSFGATTNRWMIAA